MTTDTGLVVSQYRITILAAPNMGCHFTLEEWNETEQRFEWVMANDHYDGIPYFDAIKAAAHTLIDYTEEVTE